MIVQLGVGDTVTVNMLQTCYWKILRTDNDQKIYQIAFAGGTLLTLTFEESACFEQFLKQSSEPKLIQPVHGNQMIFT